MSAVIAAAPRNCRKWLSVRPMRALIAPSMVPSPHQRPHTTRRALYRGLLAGECWLAIGADAGWRVLRLARWVCWAAVVIWLVLSSAESDRWDVAKESDICVLTAEAEVTRHTPVPAVTPAPPARLTEVAADDLIGSMERLQPADRVSRPIRPSGARSVNRHVHSVDAAAARAHVSCHGDADVRQQQGSFCWRTSDGCRSDDPCS